MSEVRCARLLRIEGLVQGVGFRPSVHRLATALGVAGWVGNDAEGVFIHCEAPRATLDLFEREIVAHAPPSARIDALRREDIPPTEVRAFTIRASTGEGARLRGLRVPLDRAVCPACLAEVNDPPQRRFRYPFTTCTDCGPRYSIQVTLPHDRPTTRMASFPLCADCQAEYDSPRARRFHAQTMSCPACGPRLELRDDRQGERWSGEAALQEAIRRLSQGAIVALKGLGGFQLLVRADDEQAVTCLRQRKHRPSKPFALMVRSLEQASTLGSVADPERTVLQSAENPILLLEKRTDTSLSASVAPHLRHLGVMLPTTPLHHLLLAGLDVPLVATSGNHSEEPILLDEGSAGRQTLAEIADVFLIHNRPIERRVDDSVVRLIKDRPVVLRLARGYAPLALPTLERYLSGLCGAENFSILAVGAQQKNALALWTGSQAILSSHIGDLDNIQTQQAFVDLGTGLERLYGCTPRLLACDLHPGYYSTEWARATGKPCVAVQHHHAHAVACMVENDCLNEEVLAFTWDGTGQGPDDTVWGGEVLRATLASFVRVATLLPFPLPGSESAIRHPNRVALALLAATKGADALLADAALLERLKLDRQQAAILLRMIERGINTPWTTSMGRLFDGVAALVLGIDAVSYEGEAACWLEASAASDEQGIYAMPLLQRQDGLWQGDWRPVLGVLLQELTLGVPAAVCAGRFHNSMAHWAQSVARLVPDLPVVLSGGCFQNALLSERTQEALENEGRHVCCHGQIPPNDGGLAVGQLAVALARAQRSLKGTA